MSTAALCVYETSGQGADPGADGDLFHLSGLPQFLIDVTDEGDLIFAEINPAHEALTGLRNEDVAGRTPEDFLPPAIARTVRQNYARCVETKAVYAYDEVLTFPNGERWYRTTLTPRMGPNSHVVRIFGQALDITDLMQEITLKSQSIAQLETVVADYSRFVPLMAHDFRGPMGEVGSALNIILQDFRDLGDGKRDMLAASCKTVADVTRQFDEVLAFCATISIDRPAFKRRISLAKLASDMVGVVDPAGRMDVSFQDRLISCDQAELQITLRNLLSNACKFADGRVSIDIVPGDTYGFVRLIVCDDGPGFPDAPTSPAASGDQAPDPVSGHGFGLVAVRHLASRAGGALTIDRCPELGGARVSIQLEGTVL